MGRHGDRAAVPPTPWYARAGRAALRWLGRLTLGALAGAVVLGATSWAGTSWESARALGAGAAVLVVVASALAATVPAPRDPTPPGRADDRDGRPPPA